MSILYHKQHDVNYNQNCFIRLIIAKTFVDLLQFTSNLKTQLTQRIYVTRPFKKGDSNTEGF